MRVVPLALILLLALALPAATGQVPTVPTCGPISIAEPGVPAPLAPGQAVDIGVEVTNEGQTLPADVTLTAATTEPGWTFVQPEPASVAPGASRTFTVRVIAGEAATSDATVTFLGTGECTPPQGLPCPAGCDFDDQTTQVQVPLAPAPSNFLDELNIPLEYLIAAIVLVGLATAIPFAMRGRKGGIVADCPEPLKMVRAGRGTSFPIEIRNGAKDAATAAFEVGPVPEGWSAFMPLPEVQLAAKEARSLWLMVRSPATANVGDTVDVELRLRDAKRGGAGSVVRVRAEVQGGAEA